MGGIGQIIIILWSSGEMSTEGGVCVGGIADVVVGELFGGVTRIIIRIMATDDDPKEMT